jgi:motility quorum-sensing regulator / GCU-specific mRNA interferase toxin
MGVWWGYGRGTEKRKPDHDLANIKRAFADPKTLNRTFTAKQGADALEMDDDAVVAVIQGLSPRDFDKSMTSIADHRVWQDVYRPRVKERELYVKFTLDSQGALLLISFKEA